MLLYHTMYWLVAILLTTAPFTPPPPPLGPSVIRSGQTATLTWVQQSDANVFCIDQEDGPAWRSLGCEESAPGLHYFPLPSTAPGIEYYVHEWDHEDTWIDYGVYGPALVPQYVYIPLVAR